MLLAHHRRRGPGGRRDRSRGAVMIEAAIVTPLFFALVFALVEVGLTMNDDLAVAHSTRSGSRVASASGDDLFADYGIIQTIRRESAALDPSLIERIVVYKPTGPGAEPTAGCKAGTPSTGVCNVYSGTDLTKDKTKFGCLTGQQLDKYWCPTTRKVTLTGAGTDYVGVYMQVRHPYITKVFGNSITLTDHSVIRLEPRFKS